jgi:hypothetical protein
MNGSLPSALDMFRMLPEGLLGGRLELRPGEREGQSAAQLNSKLPTRRYSTGAVGSDLQRALQSTGVTHSSTSASGQSGDADIETGGRRKFPRVKEEQRDGAVELSTELANVAAGCTAQQAVMDALRLLASQHHAGVLASPQTAGAHTLFPPSMKASGDLR